MRTGLPIWGVHARVRVTAITGLCVRIRPHGLEIAAAAGVRAPSTLDMA